MTDLSEVTIKFFFLFVMTLVVFFYAKRKSEKLEGDFPASVIGFFAAAWYALIAFLILKWTGLVT